LIILYWHRFFLYYCDQTPITSLKVLGVYLVGRKAMPMEPPSSRKHSTRRGIAE